MLTYNQSSNICNGKVGEIGIGSSPHVLTADDDNAGGEVTKHSNNQEDAIEDSEGEKGWPVDMGFTKYRHNISSNVFSS